LEATGSPYGHVLSPIRIKDVEIPNRIVRTAHGTGFAEGGIGPDFIAYHEARARGGVGLTILEIASVHPTAQGGIKAWDDSVLTGYADLLKALRPYPMKIFQQLFHGGRQFVPPDGGPPWSASPMPSPGTGEMPLAMSLSQIDEMVAGFASAAARVVKAGLDGVEIHAGHGYLICQFLSPYTNHREDDYGGSFENRLRFLRQILEAVRSEVRDAIPVGVRISADECIDGGLVVADSIRIAQTLEAAGLIDFLNVSLGSLMNYTKVIGGNDEPLGYELPMSVPVARSVKVPAIVAGRIKSLAQADQIIRDGDADLVGMVRALIADPELVSKSARGEESRVRPCIGCNQGCVGRYGGHLGCTVNALVGREAEVVIRPAAERRRVVVVGGGPAGMESARVASLRGHDVTLFEATASLGGQLRLARLSPLRGEMGEIADWLALELAQLGVEIHLGIAAAASDVLNIEPHAVIVATGSRPRRDGYQIAIPLSPIPGAGLPHVKTSWDIFVDGAGRARSAVVFDDVGHYEAIAVAEQLLEAGLHVTLVTRLPRIAPLLEPARMEGTVKRRLMPRDFDFVVDAGLLGIEPGRVIVGSLYGGPSRSVPAELVVMVGANLPARDLADQLAGRVSQVELVGDARGPRFLQLAMAEGFRAGAGV
jgi:2,4-dienoyl-CoA reductase-like NADH-dependent reductase (Old Yellow Enzyme family)